MTTVREHHGVAWWQPALITAAAALALAIITLAPMSFHPGSYLYAYAHPGDAMISIWTTWVRLQALAGRLSMDHVTLVAAPQGGNLLGYPPEPITEWPLLWLARIVGEIAAFNVLILLSFPMAAASMALLVFHVTRSRGAAILSGLLYAFLPYHLAHSMHMSLGAIQWLPLALWAWFRLRERPGFPRACALAAACLAVLWATVYYAYLLAVASLLFVLWTLRRGTSGFSRRRFLGWALGALGMAGLAAGPLLLPFFKVAGAARVHDVGRALLAYGHPLKDLFVFSAKPWDYCVPPLRNLLVGPLVAPFVTAHLYGSNIVEQTLYLGVVPLGLALFAWRHRYTLDDRTRDALGFGVALAVVALWWSAPPYVPLGAFRIEHNEIISAHRLWFPSGLIYHLAPALRFLRVHARFGLLVGLAVSFLAGIGWMALMRRVLTPWRRWAIIGAIVVFSCVEFGVKAPCWDVRTPPPVYAWLTTQPDGLIVEYPFCRSTDSIHAEYLFWQRLHRHPMVNGSAGGNQDNHYRPDLANLLAPGVPEQLRDLGVAYVIVHRDAYARVAHAPRHLRVLGVDYDVPVRVETLFKAPDEKYLDPIFQSIKHSKTSFGDDTVVYRLTR